MGWAINGSPIPCTLEVLKSSGQYWAVLDGSRGVWTCLDSYRSSGGRLRLVGQSWRHWVSIDHGRSGVKSVRRLGSSSWVRDTLHLGMVRWVWAFPPVPTGGGTAGSPWLRVGFSACRYSFIESVLYIHRVPGPGTHRYLQCALVT